MSLSSNDPPDLSHHAAPSGREMLASSPGAEAYDARDVDMSLLELLSVLLRRRYTVLACTLGVTILTVVFTLVSSGRTYTSDASFLPQGTERRGVEGLQAMAGQLGIRVPSEGRYDSPEFYAELLQSRRILGQLLVDTFAVNGDDTVSDVYPSEGTIADLLGIPDSDHRRRGDAAVQWLRKEAVSVRTNRGTGVVQVSVQTPWPHVSRHIAERLLDLVQDFNLGTRQSQASAERLFVERRLGEAELELRHAEGELRRFLERNRQFENSPELLFEHDRLQRQVAMRQQVFNSLNQSHQDARIAEVRDIPVITIVEPPELPVQRDARGFALSMVIGLTLGGMIGICAAFGREFFVRKQEVGTDDYQDFLDVWEDMKRDMSRLIRLGGRSSSGVDH